jgi:hypothetical protein
MNMRSLSGSLLFSAFLGGTSLACSAAPSSAPEEHLTASTDQALVLPVHSCPAAGCDVGFHCGTICDTCAIRTLEPQRACDPIPHYFECVPDVCPGPVPLPSPIDPQPVPRP